MAEARNPLTIITRQTDGVRFGLFATDDLVHPLLKAEEDEAGGFDLATAERVPFAEAFSLLRQLNSAARAIN